MDKLPDRNYWFRVSSHYFVFNGYQFQFDISKFNTRPFVSFFFVESGVYIAFSAQPLTPFSMRVNRSANAFRCVPITQTSFNLYFKPGQYYHCLKVSGVPDFITSDPSLVSFVLFSKLDNFYLKHQFSE